MWGVFEKDYRGGKGYALAMYGISAFLGVLIILIPFMEASSAAYYLAFFAVSMSLYAILSDDRSGYAYIMAFPVDARAYVRAKLLFTIAVEVQMWIFSRLFIVAKSVCSSTPMKASEVLTAGIGYYIGAVAMLMLTLLIILKYGTQGFLYLGVVIGVVGFVFCTALLIIRNLNWLMWLGNVAHIGLIATAVAVALTALFAHLSVRVLENKEF